MQSADFSQARWMLNHLDSYECVHDSRLTTVAPSPAPRQPSTMGAAPFTVRAARQCPRRTNSGTAARLCTRGGQRLGNGGGTCGKRRKCRCRRTTGAMIESRRDPLKATLDLRALASPALPLARGLHIFTKGTVHWGRNGCHAVSEQNCAKASE